MRRAKQVIIPVNTWRYATIGLLFGLMFLVLIGRAVFLQVIDTRYLQEQGDARYLRIQRDIPTRGMVLDRHDQPLAISTPVDSIWMHPATILQYAKGQTLSQLAALLGMSADTILLRAQQKQARQFVYLKRHLPPAKAAEILALAIPGINTVREYKRYYPAGPVMGHVIGFADIDNQGQEGVESGFDKQLKGAAGKTRVLQDKFGRVVERVEQISRVQHGQAVRLSLDSRIQYLAYRYLQSAVKKHQASSASLVALDAKTGEILAMVSAPDFNPNNRADFASARFRNRAISDSFEPGSTVKPFSVALALQEGVVDPQTQIDAGDGYFYIGRNRISDTNKLGKISVVEVIQKSSNIGAAKIALLMPARDLYQVYRRLGFGQSNKLGLPGEQKGLLIERKKWRPIEHATLSYGYGLSVNTLQLARAYQALANDGVMLPVSIHPLDRPPVGVQVFSQGTVEKMNHMLQLAVSDGGTAPQAQTALYTTAGKTGTAHRVVDGQYQDDSYTSLFAGFAPAENPDIVVAITISDPRGVDYYGGRVAAPVFAKVVEGALRFRNVLPDKPDYRVSSVESRSGRAVL